jgi:hypothetical protein
MFRSKLIYAVFLLSIPLHQLLLGQTSGSFQQKIIVSAIDKNFDLINDLSRDYIVVDGIRASVISVQRLAEPRRIVLLYDVSGSTRKISGRETNISSATHEFIKRCTAKDLLALHVFASKHRAIVPLCQDPIRILTELETIIKQPDLQLLNEFGASTDFMNALKSVMADDRNELGFGDAVVIISDGELQIADSGKLHGIHRELIRKGIRLFIFRPVESIPRARIRPGPRAIFYMPAPEEELSIVSPVGGAVVNPQGPTNPFRSPTMERPLDSEWISGAIQGLLSLIRGAYIVVLEAHETVRKPHKFELQYKESQDSRRQGVQLLYPKWFLPAIY